MKEWGETVIETETRSMKQAFASKD